MSEEPSTEVVEVLVGIVGRAHGVRGDVAVEPRTDEPERRFAPGTVLRDERTGRTLRVATRRDHSGRLLVRFEGAEDRNAAEALRGIRLVVDVPVDEQPEAEGEYFDRQLIGLTVLDADGVEAGRVTAVVHLPAQDLLEVATSEGARLVPFVTALVPVVDLAAGSVQLADVPGLLHDEPEG
jgi:16S rRNA processing protein RimM